MQLKHHKIVVGETKKKDKTVKKQKEDTIRHEL